MLPLCPVCGLEIEIDELDVDLGEVIGCPECGVDLRVLGTFPIELDQVPEKEQGWIDF